MDRRAIVLLTALLTVAAAGGADLESLDARNLRRHVETLASDSFGGRAPGTGGGELAVSYLEDQLRSAGVAPGLGDRYRQPVPLHASRVDPATRLELIRAGESRILDLGSAALLLSWGPATAIPRPTPLVFVGFGITAPEFDHDDYADVDVRGRVVVVLAGEPESDDPGWFDGQAMTIYSSVDSKRRTAMAHGARATVILPSVAPGGVGHGWLNLARELAPERFQLAWGLPDHLSLVLHPDLEEWLFKGALYDLETIRDLGGRGCWQSFHLPVTLRFSGRFANRDVLAPNVVGMVRGRDPQLRDSWVVVSAHWDHLGTAPAGAFGFREGEDRIFNGAVDNALGTAGVLEMARLIAALERPPRRSILFVFTTGEESGLLGAEYFLEHPPVPLSSMIAAVNVDGLAFSSEVTEVLAVGGDLSDLEWRLGLAVNPLGLRVGTPPAELAISDGFSRSDQWAFAQAGVPSIMVNEGFPEDLEARRQAVDGALDWLMTRYHTPVDDTTQDLDYNASRRHLQAITALVLALADSPTEPSWRPQVPYAYVRAVSKAEGR